MKTQVEAVKTRFTSLLNEHQVIEKEFRKKVRDRAERQYRIVKPEASEEEVKAVVESDNPQVFSQAVSKALSVERSDSARLCLPFLLLFC
jgi:syntaxin 1B/2/3